MKKIIVIVLLLSGCGTGPLKSTREVGTAVDGLIDSTKKLQESLLMTMKQRDDFLAQIERDAVTIQKQAALIDQLNRLLEESMGQTKEAIRQRDKTDGEIHLKNGEYHEIDCTKDPCVRY